MAGITHMKQSTSAATSLKITTRNRQSEPQIPADVASSRRHSFVAQFRSETFSAPPSAILAALPRPVCGGGGGGGGGGGLVDSVMAGMLGPLCHSVPWDTVRPGLPAATSGCPSCPTVVSETDV